MSMDYLTPESDEVKQAFVRLGQIERALCRTAENYVPPIREERYLTGRDVCAAYLAPDAPNPARYPANPLHGCQRQGIPLSRSGDKERIDPKPQTGRRPVTSESGNSLRTVPAFLCFFVFCFRQRTVRPSHAKHIGHLANTLRTSSYLSSVPILERSADPVQGADAFFGQDDVVVPFRLQRYEA